VKRAVALGTLGFLAAAVPAAAQVPPAPSLVLEGPRVVASGTAFELTGSAAPPGSRVQIEVRLRSQWRALAGARADSQGAFTRRVRPARIRPRYLIRAVAADGRVSERVRVRSRDVTLASVGDVNLGDLPGAYISRLGVRYPWTSVAPVLRRADVAFGNLECAISTRGFPVPKQFNFRGAPASLRAMATFAGLDVLNLANNHVGDYGTTAMLDTIRFTRRYGMAAVGAGGSLASASEPRVVEQLGLRIAFVGFSDILPASFFAGPGRPGTQQATTENIRASVSRAKRRADVVIATFHWGVERATVEDARQRAFATEALAAGATAVIGAHPHVLQPIRKVGARRLVAYSLGNFVFGAGSPGTTSTGILELKLSTRGVERSRFRRAVIQATRPRLL
jgi:poly-gamma-glutamate synthesis protein (capsule biosynthesis protein)